MKIGILLGRFQPFHLGHLVLMLRIIRENDFLIICIGSAQKAAPYTAEERKKLICQQLCLLKINNFQIIPMIDPEPIERWPDELALAIRLCPNCQYTFYRSDKLPETYVDRLYQLGIVVKRVRRRMFYYAAPDGLFYPVRSATEIKEIHRRLGISLKGGRDD